MYGLAPFSTGIFFRIPDILRIWDGPILGIVRVIFANEKQQFAVGGNGRPQLRQFAIDIDPQVFNLEDGIGLNNVFFLGNKFARGIGQGLG